MKEEVDQGSHFLPPSPPPPPPPFPRPYGLCGRSLKKKKRALGGEATWKKEFLSGEGLGVGGGLVWVEA